LENRSSVIGISPKSIQAAQANNIKGLALFNLRQYQEALACFEKALELRPSYIEAINNKGLVYLAIGDYNKAIECFNQSTDLNPSDATIWNNKGLAFHVLRKYEDAVASYDRAIILRHNYVEAINNREASSIQIKEKQQEHQQQQEPGVSTTNANTSAIVSPEEPATEPIKKPEASRPGGGKASPFYSASTSPEKGGTGSIKTDEKKFSLNKWIILPIISVAVIGIVVGLDILHTAHHTYTNTTYTLTTECGYLYQQQVNATCQYIMSHNATATALIRSNSTLSKIK
jgi:tetratricopeptide (TPR) repeat protein